MNLNGKGTSNGIAEVRSPNVSAESRSGKSSHACRQLWGDGCPRLCGSQCNSHSVTWSFGEDVGPPISHDGDCACDEACERIPGLRVGLYDEFPEGKVSPSRGRKTKHKTDEQQKAMLSLRTRSFMSDLVIVEAVGENSLWRFMRDTRKRIRIAYSDERRGGRGHFWWSKRRKVLQNSMSQTVVASDMQEITAHSHTFVPSRLCAADTE